MDAKTIPSPVLPKQQQDCQELLLASGGSSHCLFCFYASSVTLGPSSLLENANQSQSMRRLANLPHVSTWSVEEVDRVPTRISEGREIGGRDGIAGRGYRCDVQKLSTVAVQRSPRCEWAEGSKMK